MIRYEPLVPDRCEIRILTLLPGKGHDPVRCTLNIASLDNAPNFEALSYVWGDSSDKKPIIVEGEEFPVTVNLEAALRAFRRTLNRRTLWVDAICINQNDVQEKNVQVPQMGRLYSLAKTVLVWLGPSNLNIEHAVSWTQTYIAKTYTSASAYWLKMDARAAFSEKAKHEKDFAILQALEGYFDILALPYWNRMWTFQEYRLPQNEPLCFCGNINFRATTVLGRAEEALHQVGFGILSRFSKSLGTGPEFDDLSEEEQKLIMEMQSTVRRLQRKSNAARKNMIISPRDAREDWRTKEAPLLYLLIITAERKCFDMRDKVFALYGMIPAVQEVYPPDYTKPIQDIMLETTAYIINHERGSKMWESFGLRDDRLSNTSYPSWVPDFAQADLNVPNMHRALSKDGQVVESLRQWGDAPMTKVTADLSTVCLFARTLGTCKVAFNFASESVGCLAQIRGLIQRSSSNLPEDTLRRSIQEQETLAPRIARTCVAHHVRQSKFSTEEILDTFNLIFKYLELGQDPPHPRSSCYYMIQDAVQDLAKKPLLITEGGCFGIGVTGIRDGDIVTIPPHVTLPFVLTRESTASIEGEEYHRMVGTAYIDGLMEGEFSDHNLAATVLERGLRQFLIH